MSNQHTATDSEATANINNLLNQVQPNQTPGIFEAAGTSTTNVGGSAFLNTGQTATQFFADYQLSTTATVIPYRSTQPIILTPVNFDCVYGHLATHLTSDFQTWDSLRDLYDGTHAEVDDSIKKGSRALAAAFVHMLYAHLRNCHSLVAPGMSNRYKTRPILDLRTELPSGLMTLVMQFGVSAPKNVAGNCRYLHHWDHLNSSSFGLTKNAAMNHDLFNQICTNLRRLSVPFSKIQRDLQYRTSWDTLVIEKTEYSSRIYSTLPIENYSLPRDSFLAILFNLQTSKLKASCHNPAPRIAVKKGAKTNEITALTVNSEYDASLVDSTSASSKKRKISELSDPADVLLADCLPIGPDQHVSRDGTVFDDTTDSKGSNPRQYVMTGIDGDFVYINSVDRNLSDQSFAAFCRAVFRKGF